MSCWVHLEHREVCERGAESQREGGSAFTLYLPLFQKQPRRKQGLYGCCKYFILHVLQSTTAVNTGLCRSWKIHKMHVNFYVQLFQVSCSGLRAVPSTTHSPGSACLSPCPTSSSARAEKPRPLLTPDSKGCRCLLFHLACHLQDGRLQGLIDAYMSTRHPVGMPLRACAPTRGYPLDSASLCLGFPS